MAELKYQPVLHDHEAFLKKALKRNEFREAYEDLEENYVLAREMLSARSKSGLTQEAVAELMGTTKSVVSRLEAGGKHAPSLTTLKKYAQAVGCRLEIKLVPNTCPTSRSTPAARRTARLMRGVMPTMREGDGKMTTKTIEEQAKELARANKQAEPAIEKVYWFPSDKEIRLVELEETMVPALSGHVEPFYFGPSPQDGLTAPSGIAIIQTKEFGKLKLPRGWGSWSDAVALEV